MSGSLEQVRGWYADELRLAGPVESADVLRAFATVPRERFLGPGPWRIYSDSGRGGYRTAPDADPRCVYHNVLVALDEARGINNGSPSLWAFVFDHMNLAPGEHVLHLGCGTGYYSAIMAELVGSGRAGRCGRAGCGTGRAGARSAGGVAERHVGGG